MYVLSRLPGTGLLLSQGLFPLRFGGVHLHLNILEPMSCPDIAAAIKRGMKTDGVSSHIRRGIIRGMEA
jgi:hypothetical protein